MKTKMHHVITELVWCLFMCTSVVRCTDLPRLDGLIKKCPRTFHVTRHGVAEDILVILRSGERHCRDIPEAGAATAQAQDDSLEPTISVNQNHTLNIEWNATTCQNKECTSKSKRYPRKYILDLRLVKFHADRNTTNNYEAYDRTCIKMKLDNRKVGLEASTDFYLNGCIPLVSSPNIYISVQIWSLPDGKSGPGCSGRRSPSRVKRATRCPSQSVQCSRSIYFPLSVTNGIQQRPDRTDVNTFLQCRHHQDAPVFRWKCLPSGQLTFHFSVLRPHLDHVTLRLKQHDNLLEERTFKQDYLYNKTSHRSVEFTTTESVTPGNFMLLFEAECRIGEQARRVVNIHTKTDYMDFYEYNNVTACAVPKVEVTTSIFRPVVAVVGSVCLGIVVGVVVFCLYRCRRLSSGSAADSAADKNNETQSIPLQVLSSSHRVTDFEVEETELQPKIANDYEDPKDRSPLLASPPGPTDNANGKHTDDLDRTGREHDTTNTTKILILSQPNCGDPIMDKIPAGLEAALTQSNLQVEGELSLETRLNWKEFADSASQRFGVFIIVLSEDFYDLCSLRNKEQLTSGGLPQGEESRLDGLLNERDNETIPCVVLDGIKSLSGTQVAHTVIIVASRDLLVQSFLDDHGYLNTANCTCRVLPVDELVRDGDVVLSTRLKQMLVHSR